MSDQSSQTSDCQNPKASKRSFEIKKTPEKATAFPSVWVFFSSEAFPSGNTSLVSHTIFTNKITLPELIFSEDSESYLNGTELFSSPIYKQYISRKVKLLISFSVKKHTHGTRCSNIRFNFQTLRNYIKYPIIKKLTPSHYLSVITQLSFSSFFSAFLSLSLSLSSSFKIERF